MGRELGRISGPLLADNLKRNGNNLAFESSLLYLDVVNNRIGFNTSIPTRDLLVKDNTNTTNLIVTTEADLGSNLVFTGSQIQNFVDVIYIQPNQSSNPSIVAPTIGTDSLNFGTNVITSTTNSDINFSPAGTGGIVLNSNTLVSGNLHATGNITWDGNVTLGNANTDTITFAAGIHSDIIPTNPLELITPVSEPVLAEDGQILLSEDGQTLYTNLGVPFYQNTPIFNLGSSSLEWNSIYAQGLYSSTGSFDNLTAGNMYTGGLRITDNTISSVNPTSDIILRPTVNPLGVVLTNSNIQLNNYNFVNSSNIAFTISGTSNGYIKFSGSNGLALPEGNSSSRQLTPEPGTTRFNTDIGTPEVYDATAGWIPVRGTQSVINTDTVTDIADIWSLILGL